MDSHSLAVTIEEATMQSHGRTQQQQQQQDKEEDKRSRISISVIKERGDDDGSQQETYDDDDESKVESSSSSSMRIRSRASCSRAQQQQEEEEEKVVAGPRERLKRYRRERAGNVWIPEMWGQEDFLKDWIDCNAFDASLVNRNIMLARASLMQQHQPPTATARPAALENSC